VCVVGSHRLLSNEYGHGVSGTTSAPSASSTTFPSAESRFLGEWDTGPYSAGQLRAAITAGFTKSDVDEWVGKKTKFELNLNFYSEDGVPFVSAVGWDPTKGEMPSDSDHGPYAVLPGHKLKITCDVCNIRKNYQLYSYALHGDTLTLRFIRNVDPNMSSYDRHFEVAFGISQTFKPLHKVG
jgi:hypothetical protein